jgi:hypothetical protein
MGRTPSARKPKRTRSTATSDHQAAGKRRKTAAVAPTVWAEQRHALIAERAYRRAQQRGFKGGDPVEDWLASEREVDALLSRLTK